jgi:hypothetical protein
MQATRVGAGHARKRELLRACAKNKIKEKEEKPGCRWQPGFMKRGRSNEAGVGDGSNRFSGYPAGEAPFRSLPHLITPQDDPLMTPKLSIGNFGA